jgi:hypothetical protein
MTLGELLDEADLVRQRGWILRELVLFVEREWPRGGVKYVTVDGARRPLRRDAVEDVREVLMHELCRAWRERRRILEHEVGDVADEE